MKKIIYLSLILTVSIWACKKESIPLYDNNVSNSSIYFTKADTTNNMFISFGYTKSAVKDSIIKIVVRAIGNTTDKDRTYNLSIADSSTLKAGVDYEILNKTTSIAAGKVADTLKIKLNRTAQLRSDSLFLYLDLKPNENFTNNYLSRQETSGGKIFTKYFTRLRIKVDDIAGAPGWWLSGSSYYSYTFGYLGTFSVLKLQLMATKYNLKLEELAPATWFLANSNYRRFIPWADGLKAYFLQMQALNTPVYEADGKTLMTMGINAK